MSINLERMLLKRNATQQSTQNLKNQTVEVKEARVSDVVLICGCEGSKITIDADKVTKLVVDKCTDTTVVVGCDLMTQMVECINSQRVNVIFTKPSVQTIQIDNVQDTTLTFTTSLPPYAKIISTGNCSGLVVQLESDTYHAQFPIQHPLEEGEGEQTDLAITQFRTCFAKDFNSIITEKIIREGCGYVTTEKEKKINDARQALLESKMEEFIEKSLDFESMKQTRLEKSQNKPSRPWTKKVEQSGEGSSLLDQIQGFAKNKLNKAETKITNLTDVVGDEPILPSDKGSNTGDVTGAITDEDELREYFDDEDKLIENVKIIADLLRNAKHAVVYTGAGISTSASIPDYRGPNGVWTLRSQGKSHMIKTMDIEQAYPTYGHYAIVEMLKRGIVKHVVSTNVDGLHRRSGLTQDEISELHGNIYRENCATCDKEYLRGFDVCKTVQNYRKHITGRKCTCGGSLKDNIIHFGESLPVNELKKAAQHSKQADLTLVLGTSMRVQPACSLPVMTVKKGTGRMVIINLQKTPFDNRAYLIARAKTDNFLELLAKELGIEEVNQEFDALAEIREQSTGEEAPPKSDKSFLFE
jgi:mono-ADP-ribosyltransferase sirtuin 6